jgi:hypothetical protein
MQEWLNHIESDSDYTDLRQRFRSRDDEQFRSAFLELYLHESLLRAGYAITIHPSVDGTWDADSAPSHRWEHDGWSVSFKLIPKKREARGRRTNSRALGVYGHTGVDWVGDPPAIRKALASKHHEYGDLDAPFIIAVGTYVHDRDRWHTTNAMYGAAAIEWNKGPDGKTVTREIRQPDGYFGVPPDRQHRNISGVLLINQLMPYYLQRAEVTLWRHPNPVLALPDELGLPGHEVTLERGRLREVLPASTAGEFFGLPDPWPPGEAWPAAD